MLKSFRRMRIVALGVLLVLTVFSRPLTLSASASAEQNPVSVTLDTQSPIYFEDTINYNRLISTYQSLHTVVSKNGNISVINQFPNENTGLISVYEFSPQNELLRSLDFQPVLPKVGGFTKDDEGNFYIFYGKDVEEGAFSEQNMVLVKYSPDGVKLDEEWIKARDNEKTHIVLGVKIPAFGEGMPCAIEISGNQIAVYMSYISFDDEGGFNHQCTTGILFDLKTLEQKAPEDGNGILYASHSGKEYLLPSGGVFVSANMSDAAPYRAFVFYKGGSDYAHSFDFSNPTEYLNYDAEFGGISETTDGYIALGTYSNDASPNSFTDEGLTWGSGGPIFYPRNVFLMLINKEVNDITKYIWLTDYASDEKVCIENPKLVRLERDRYLIMYVVDSAAYRIIIDGKGNIIAPLKAMPDNIKLSATHSVPRYNPVNKKVYWAVRTDKGTPMTYYDEMGEPTTWTTLYTEMELYAYDPYADIPAAPEYVTNPPKPMPLYAHPSSTLAYMNNKAADYEFYHVGDADYFKLRDIAYSLNGSVKQFEIGYDNSRKAITLTSGKAYTPTDSDMKQGDSMIKIAEPVVSKIHLDGRELNLTAYTIGGNNYVELREFMKALDVYFYDDNSYNGIVVDPSKNYEYE